MPDPIKPAGTPTPNPAPAATPAPVVTPPAPVALKPGDPTPPPAAQKPGEATMVPLTALQEEREKRQALSVEIEQLKKIVGANVLYDIHGNPVAQPAAPRQAPMQIDPMMQEVEKLWESDPRKAVQTELIMAINWYDRVSMEMDDAEAGAASRYADFNDFRTPARKYVRSLPLQQRNQPGVWDAAYYFAKGQKVDDIIAREREALTNKFNQSGSLPGALPPGAFTPPPAPSAVTLSPDELKVCEVMGIKPEDYINNKRVKT
jgi:hypothetical protein